MKTELTIKNFRVFDHKDGGTVRLAPITLLTGCNSSGKSSVVKALVLLKDFFKQIETENFDRCKLDFGNSLAKLGKFDLVVNNNIENEIEFEYKLYSPKLERNIIIKMVFRGMGDELCHGWLDSIEGKIEGDSTPLFHKVVNDDKGSFTNKRTIVSTFMIYALKRLIDEEILDNLVTIESAILNGDNDVCKIGHIEELLNALSKYLPKDDFAQYKTDIYPRCIKYIDSYLIDCEDEDSGGIVKVCWHPKRCMNTFKGNKKLYLEAAQRETIIPLPLWSLLDGVEKSKTREVLENHLAQGDMNASKPVLDYILKKFEESKQDSLLSFFKCKENEWLDGHRSKLYIDYINPLYDDDDDVGISLFKCDYDFHDKQNIKEHENYLQVWDDDVWPNVELVERNTVFELLFYLASIYGIDEDDYFVDAPYERTRLSLALATSSRRKPNIVEDCREYFGELMKDVLTPTMFKNFEYCGDATMTVKRIYTREQRDGLGELLFNYLDGLGWNFEGDYCKFTNEWVKKFGLGDHISITSTAEGMGVIVKLHRTPDDEEGRLLADEGFGVTKLIGTLLNVEMAILKAKADGGKEVTIAIEEPENHLHPKYQSLLAEMFADAYKKYGIHFIIETHSEYMVRKLQVLVAREDLTPEEVSLQYFYNPDIEQRPQGEQQVKDIPIREDGILLAPFGPGFVDETASLVKALLKS